MKKPILWVMILLIIAALLGVTGISSCKTQPVAEKKIVFGNLPVALSDEWGGFSVENFKYAAAKKGIEVQVLDASWDGKKQLSNLEDLITKKVDQIGVFVYTPEEAQKFLTKANEAKIPISFENTKLVDKVTGDYVVNVAFEYYDFGYQAVKFISENYPGSKLFYVRGLPGMGIVEEYMRGIEQSLEDSGNKITLAIQRDTNWDTKTAQDATTDVIASGEEFDVIFANNESMAQGVYNALKDAGLAGKIPIVSTGGGPTGIKMLNDGIIQATIAGPVSLQGLYLFKAMYLNATQGINPPEKYIAPGVIAITVDNLDKNIPWQPSDALIDMIGGLDKW